MYDCTGTKNGFDTLITKILFNSSMDVTQNGHQEIMPISSGHFRYFLLCFTQEEKNMTNEVIDFILVVF